MELEFNIKETWGKNRHLVFGYGLQRKDFCEKVQVYNKNVYKHLEIGDLIDHYGRNFVLLAKGVDYAIIGKCKTYVWRINDMLEYVLYMQSKGRIYKWTDILS